MKESGIKTSFEELLLVKDSNIKDLTEGYSFGLSGGQRYLRDQLEGNELINYFKNIECCLMPFPGWDICKSNVTFNDLENEFNVQLSQLFKSKLLNTKEIKVKTDPQNFAQCLKPQELVLLFKRFVNKLNGDSVSIDFESHFITTERNKKQEVDTGSDSTQEYSSICLQTEQLRNKSIDSDQSYLNRDREIERVTKKCEQTLGSVQSFIESDSFCENSRNDLLFVNSGYQNVMEQTFTSDSNTGKAIPENKTRNVSEQTNNDTKDVIRLMEGMSISDDNQCISSVCDQRNVVKTYASAVSCSTQTSLNLKGLEDDENQQSIEPMDCQQNNNDCNESKGIPLIDLTTDDSMDTTSPHNSTNDGSQQLESHNEVEKSSVKSNIDVISEEGFEKYCQMLSTKYENKIKSFIYSSNFNLGNGFSIVHKTTTAALLKIFDDNFKDIKINDLREKYRNHLIEIFRSLKSKLEAEEQQLLAQITENYNKCVKESLIIYENRIQNYIEKYLNNEIKSPDFNHFYSQSKKEVIEEFERKVKQMDKTYAKITDNYKSNIKLELNKREDNYKNAINIINSYLKEWENAFKINRCFGNLSENHLNFKRKLNLIENKDLISFVSTIVDNLFKKINAQNAKIIQKESEITEKSVKVLIDKFWQQFNRKLNSGFFPNPVVKEMFDRFLNYTIGSVEVIFDLKPQQNQLISDLKKELRFKIEEDFKKNLLEYSQKSTENKNVIQRARRDSISLYINQMTKSLSQKTSFKVKEFESLSSANREEALNHNLQRLSSLKNDLNIEFFNFILRENQDHISDKIKDDEQIFLEKYVEKETNQSNCSSFAVYFSRYYLFGGIFDQHFQLVLNREGNRCRNNCIAISDEILFGKEAMNYIQSIGDELLNPVFDIKNLLFNKKCNLREEELNSYPFDFCEQNNSLKVKIQNNIKYELSIQSMIALQVLDIKSDAEKQLGNTITSAVFTVPTHNSIRKRNAFKDVAAIAGLESVHILSEITAASIGYSHEFKPQIEVNVLFVAINDYECDAAVCRLIDTKIEYLCYFNENLATYEKSTWQKCVGIVWKNEPDQDVKIEKSFISLLDKIKNWLKSKDMINDIVLIGGSNLMTNVKTHIINYFEGKPIKDYTQTDIVIKGSTLFNKSITENNPELRFDIKEVVFHKLEYTYHRYGGQSTLFYENTKLPQIKMPIELGKISPYDLPIKIVIYQDKVEIAEYYIQLPEDFYNYHELSLKFCAENFGKVNVFSILKGNHGFRDIEIKLLEKKLGLSERDIIEDKIFIQKFKQMAEESKIENQKKLSIDKSRKELEDLYLNIKKRVENNSELRGPKKRKIEEQLKKTEQLLNDKEFDSFSIQTTLLKDMIKILKI